SFLVTLVLTGWLLVTVPKGFIPSPDTGQAFGYTEAAQDTSFEAMVRYQSQAHPIIAGHPAVDGFVSVVGFRGPNSGVFFVARRPRADRPSVDQGIGDLQSRLASIPGLRAFLQTPPVVNVGGQL